jgi:hypothetical protein
LSASPARTHASGGNASSPHPRPRGEAAHRRRGSVHADDLVDPTWRIPEGRDGAPLKSISRHQRHRGRTAGHRSLHGDSAAVCSRTRGKPLPHLSVDLPGPFVAYRQDRTCWRRYRTFDVEACADRDASGCGPRSCGDVVGLLLDQVDAAAGRHHTVVAIAASGGAESGSGDGGAGAGGSGCGGIGSGPGPGTGSGGGAGGPGSGPGEGGGGEGCNGGCTVLTGSGIAWSVVFIPLHLALSGYPVIANRSPRHGSNLP